jgi:hypothetical protein
VNQIDVQPMVLVGTGILVLFVVIWLLGLRRQTRSDPRRQSLTEPPRQAFTDQDVRLRPSDEQSKRQTVPEVESGPRLAEAPNVQPRKNVDAAFKPAPPPAPAAAAVSLLETQNGEAPAPSTYRIPPESASAPVAVATEPTPLFRDDQRGALRSRWGTIQSQFVDEPRESVEQADELVAEAITHLERLFAEQRTSLERKWECADDVSTEELRTVLRGYRSFFERLLAA